MIFQSKFFIVWRNYFPRRKGVDLQLCLQRFFDRTMGSFDTRNHWPKTPLSLPYVEKTSSWGYCPLKNSPGDRSKLRATEKKINFFTGNIGRKTHLIDRTMYIYMDNNGIGGGCQKTHLKTHNGVFGKYMFSAAFARARWPVHWTLHAILQTDRVLWPATRYHAL